MAEAIYRSDEFLTVDAYLERERQSEVRHRYFDGEVFPIEGESDEHVNPNPAKREVRIFRRSDGWEPGVRLHDGEFTLRSVGLTLNVSDLYVA